MKLISAIIRPHVLDEVREAVAQAGVQGMTVTEVKGFGRQKGHAEMNRGAEYSIAFVPKVKLEIVVGDDRVQQAVDAIKQTAQTGKIGGGKIFVSEMKKAVRIRTGEEGTEGSAGPASRPSRSTGRGTALCRGAQGEGLRLRGVVSSNQHRGKISRAASSELGTGKSRLETARSHGPVGDANVSHDSEGDPPSHGADAFRGFAVRHKATEAEASRRGSVSPPGGVAVAMPASGQWQQ